MQIGKSDFSPELKMIFKRILVFWAEFEVSEQQNELFSSRPEPASQTLRLNKDIKKVDTWKTTVRLPFLYSEMKWEVERMQKRQIGKYGYPSQNLSLQARFRMRRLPLEFCQKETAESLIRYFLKPSVTLCS